VADEDKTESDDKLLANEKLRAFIKSRNSDGDTEESSVEVIVEEPETEQEIERKTEAKRIREIEIEYTDVGGRDLDLDRYDDKLVAERWNYLPTTDQYRAFMSEAQLAILSGEMPVELTEVRPLNNAKTKWIAYVTHTTVSQILDRAFLFNWEMVIENSEIKTAPGGKQEAFIEGYMLISGANAQKKIRFWSGHKIIAANPNLVIAKV